MDNFITIKRFRDLKKVENHWSTMFHDMFVIIAHTITVTKSVKLARQRRNFFNLLSQILGNSTTSPDSWDQCLLNHGTAKKFLQLDRRFRKCHISAIACDLRIYTKLTSANQLGIFHDGGPSKSQCSNWHRKILDKPDRTPRWKLETCRVIFSNWIVAIPSNRPSLKFPINVVTWCLLKQLDFLSKSIWPFPFNFPFVFLFQPKINIIIKTFIPKWY